MTEQTSIFAELEPPDTPSRSIRDGRAVLLVGRLDSQQSRASASITRTAAHAQREGIALLVGVCFLHERRPSLVEGINQSMAAGARQVIVVPFLTECAKTLRHEVACALEAARADLPHAAIQLTPTLGDHPALARLVLQRALEADYLAAHPFLTGQQPARPLVQATEPWQPLYTARRTGLLLVAHGSADMQAQRCLNTIAQRIRSRQQYVAVGIGFLEHNRLNIADAVAAMARRRIENVIVVPYALERNRQIDEQLPTLISEQQARFPVMPLLLAAPLGYDRLLVNVIADRLAQARLAAGRWAAALPGGD